MRRRVFNLLCALSLTMCGVVMSLRLAVDDQYVIQQGNGGIAGGGDIATVALINQDGWVGIGWTYSDVWFDNHLAVPSVPTLLIVLVLPYMWLIVPMRPRRAAGLCPTCGYDLRATPDRCPECGRAPTAVEV